MIDKSADSNIEKLTVFIKNTRASDDALHKIQEIKRFLLILPS